jgi:hypothetical protein
MGSCIFSNYALLKIDYCYQDGENNQTGINNIALNGDTADTYVAGTRRVPTNIHTKGV